LRTTSDSRGWGESSSCSGMDNSLDRLVRTSRSGRPDLRQSTAPVNSCLRPAPYRRPRNDTIDAPDGNKDIIHCGKCIDTVTFDPGIDEVVKKNTYACEIKHPM
jgi:hypothetical protein